LSIINTLTPPTWLEGIAAFDFYNLRVENALWHTLKNIIAQKHQAVKHGMLLYFTSDEQAIQL
jgi:hypothetical protein